MCHFIYIFSPQENLHSFNTANWTLNSTLNKWDTIMETDIDVTLHDKWWFNASNLHMQAFFNLH